MTNDLTSWVVDQIIETELDDETGYLVLAALEGDTEFGDYLSKGTRTREIRASDAPQAKDRQVGGTFLKSIEVQGFRGIGEKVTLELVPRPGLTVVAGRNGSGKSSVAEALELILTGSTYRWKKRTQPWRKVWRNLHHPQDTTIRVTVAEEGVDKLTTICTEWDNDAIDVEDNTVWTQVHGKPRGDLDALGWADPLETFRPLLSYDELGGILVDGQAPLYDALATVLGVEQLTDALKRIGDRAKVLKAPLTQASAERRSLQSEAAMLPDERAVSAAALLKKTAPDADAVRAVVTGVEQIDGGPVAALRTLAAVASPTAEQATSAATALRAAVQGMSDAGEQASKRELDRIALRKRALAVHREHGDMPCPVCAGGTLDAAWAFDSAALVKKVEEETGVLQQAGEELDRCRTMVQQVLARRPAALDHSPVPELDGFVDAARTAWDEWSAAPEGDLTLADHLELHVGELIGVLEPLRAAATEAAASRDDVWAPLASRIASWCDTWAATQKSKPVIDQLIAAEAWLKEVDKRAKNERLAPIVDGARAAWAKLRQESNVDLTNLELSGSKTSRKVEISATVDGKSADALPVMSQGELHALALALFLPRASLAESPFRFLVIDDPVQAMDPAKVDGLVELLTELAKTRQVIVLSHDDRLPAAVRRSQVDAHLYEVRRGTESHVEIITAQDPAQRYLDDAFGMISDTDLPAETLRRALPGLLRMATEAAALDRFFGTALKDGAKLEELEQKWADARKTSQRVSLALHGEAKDLSGWLAAGYRKDGLGVISSGFHDGVNERANIKDLTRCVERMVADIRTGAK